MILNNLFVSFPKRYITRMWKQNKTLNANIQHKTVEAMRSRESGI